MTTPLFTGVGVALVTVFDGAGEVDAAATADVAAALVDAGVRCVLVAGSTGEAPSLSAEERVELLTAVRKVVPADVALLAGTGAPSTKQAVELTVAACDAGADAVLVLSPPDGDDLGGYYERVAGVSSVPVLAYHFPAASAPGIPVAALASLPVAGLKDSTGDAGRLLEELDAFTGWLYTGSANLVHLAGSVGCAGAILAIANVEPELAIRAFGGDAGAQRTLAGIARSALARRPHSLKEAVATRFGVSAACRMGEALVEGVEHRRVVLEQ